MTELLASASRSFVRLLASHEERSGQDGHSIMEIVAGEKETYNTLVFQYAGTNGSMRISFFLENGSRD